MSAARYALLGLLRDRPAYAYELANRLQELLGPAWAINPGQVSNTLRALQKDGLIMPVGDAPVDRKGRQVMAITQQGIEELDRWLFEPSAAASLPRRPLLVKLALARPERLEACLRQIEAYRFVCAERLKEAARRHDAVHQGEPLRADHVLLRLGLKGDMFHLDAEVKWARHAHEVVSWLLRQEAIWPGSRDRAAAKRAYDQRGARERLFGRMAARHLQPVWDSNAGEDPDAAP